jgi:hypothetical protein
LFADLFVGGEFSKRDLSQPGEILDFSQPGEIIRKVEKGDLDEYLGRAYVYWTPHPWFALSAEYLYGRFERPPEFMGEEQIQELTTNRFSVGVGLFHPLGLSAGLKPAFIDQKGKFGVGDPFFSVTDGDDRFWVVDAFIGYRLPKRWGLITLEAKNLLNENFRFQDTDPKNPSIAPERVILGRVTLTF